MSRRPAPTRPLQLADFRTRRLWPIGNHGHLIRQWQAERLISVQPVTRDTAWIELTEAGRAQVANIS